MMDWRKDLRALVLAHDLNLFPLHVDKAEPPSGLDWPASLSASAAIRDFYALCDGGFIGDFDWYALASLEAETNWWVEGSKGYYDDGRDALVAGRHVVLAVDSGGAPLIWDAQTDLMATFWLKGGDWEPTGQDFDAFLSALFTPAGDSDMWAEALAQLRAQSVLYSDDARPN